MKIGLLRESKYRPVAKAWASQEKSVGDPRTETDSWAKQKFDDENRNENRKFLENAKPICARYAKDGWIWDSEFRRCALRMNSATELGGTNAT